MQEAFEAHRRQPAIEKRFEQIKTVFELAPIFLKNEARIEALFCLYFLALLVQALVERELREGMKRAGVAELPIYPEERQSHRSTAEQVFRLFAHPTRTVLVVAGKDVRSIDPALTDLQRQVLQLMGVPASAYRARS